MRYAATYIVERVERDRTAVANASCHQPIGARAETLVSELTPTSPAGKTCLTPTDPGKFSKLTGQLS